MSLDFVNTYSQLINLSADADSSTFYSTEDYRKLQTLGPSLPTLSYPFPSAEANLVGESTIDVKLKSIRPPFKFTTELKAIPGSLSIYKLKNQLIDEVVSLKEAGICASNLKFMIKSKILTDTTTIGLLGDEVSITVMITQPSPNDTSKLLSDPEPELEAPKSISKGAWDKIESVISADLGPEAAKIAVSKFKQVSI